MVILSLRLGPARDVDGDDVAALVPERAPCRSATRWRASLGRVGLGRADDLELLRVARLLVLDVDADADADRLGVDLLLVDDRRAAQPLLELGDPLLEQGLLVLGVVVLGVLRDVAELARLLDPLGDLATLDGGQVLELARGASPALPG